MNSKKTIAGLSALSVLLSSTAFTAMNAFAEEAADFTTGKITAHLYSNENLRDIDCRYYNDMPNVPYIKLSDYYNCWMSQHTDNELVITNKNDGTYEVKVPYGSTGIIDVKNEVISTAEYEGFVTPGYLMQDDGGDIFTYIKETDHILLDPSAETDEDDEEATIELADYKIDLRGDDSDIWWPVQTLCDFYECGYNQASIIDGELYFTGHIMSPYSRGAVTATAAHVANFTEQYKNGRPKDLVEYNYNELCFAFDKYYGFPGRFRYNDLLAETNFDTMLSTASDGTKKVKELLLSENVYEYCAGYELLNNYFWDGGHTYFSEMMLQPETEFTANVVEKLNTIEFPEDAVDWAYEYYSDKACSQLAEQAKLEMQKTADFYEKLKMSEYCVKGDTAVFSFKGFDDSGDNWNLYYYENGKLPQDLVTEFYNCVKKAEEDPAIKNFAIDLGSNEGGTISILEYMMSLINDLDNVTVYFGPQSPAYKVYYTVDKNLDKAFDEKDKAFKTDLNFGIITSQRSFSCANLMPSLAKDSGIMLVGEKSGGGTCSVNQLTTADGMLFNISTGLKFADKDGNTIDNGIEPDYALVKTHADSTKDYSDVYNFSKLSALFAEFYGKKSEAEPTDTTTTNAATTTTTSTTTTTTTTTTSTTSATSTSSSTAASTTSAASGSTTTTANTSDLPQTGNNSTGTAAAAACAAVMAIAGGAVMLMVRRKED